MRLKSFLPLVCFGVFVSCASNTSIFPQITVSLSEADLTLPNPIDIIPDTANNQILVINSNVDYFFNQGSLYTLDVDATDPASPQLTATSAIVIPNFAGQGVFNGGNLYIPFRQGSVADNDIDLINSYTVGAGSLTAALEGTVGKNPFGIALNGAELFVVNDETISVLDTSLNIIDEIDLTTANTAGITKTTSKYAESIVVDAANDRLYVSNRDGKIFVVSISTRAITHVIDGPTNSRGMAIDGTRIYLVDGNAPSLWVFDTALLPAAATPPQEVDDAVITVGVIDLGINPNGVAVDPALNRVYVTNTGENTLSVISTTLLKEISRISFNNEDTGFVEDGKQPFGLGLGTFGGTPFVFVGNFDSNTIFVINAQTLNIVEVFPDP